VFGYEFKRHSLDSLRPLSMNRQPPGVARADRDRGHGANPVFKVVLIYQNFAAGVRARSFFEKLASALDRKLEEQVWTFDALGMREMRNAAASAARKADVVAVSVSAQLQLPGAVRAWFDMWLWILEEEDPVLVALFESSGEPNIVPIHDYLNWVARRARIEFFVAHRHVSSSTVVPLIEEGIWNRTAEQAVLSYLKTKGSVPSTLTSRLPPHSSPVTPTGTSKEK
jgi:hypothetical protein